ncbi:hypothetical protein ACF0H5_009987 [Mactra antiquata]
MHLKTDASLFHKMSSTPSGQRVCCFKKLKGFFIISVVLVTIFLFFILVFHDNGFFIILGNAQEQQTNGHRIQNKYWKHVKKINTLENKPVAEVVFMDKNNTLVLKDSIDSRVSSSLHEPKLTFIRSLEHSKISLNRTAFGNKYELSKTRSKMYDLSFTIDGRQICEKVKDPFLVITVLSVHTHVDTRTAIRNTWGRSSNPGVWPKVGNLKQKVKLVFLFGNPKNELESKIVTEESKMYGDIVQADFEDSYFNLTYKTLTGLRWVAEYCPGTKYILKADEDVFVHVYNLINFLLSQKPKQRTIFGHVIYNSDVLRQGRWGVSRRSFPLDTYPYYTCGNTYVIPGELAKDLFYTAGFLPYLNIEDVFVTGVLRSFIKAAIFDVIGFTHWFEKRPKPCEFKNTVRISATKITDYMQYEIWEGIKQQQLKDCYKVIRVVHVKTKRPDTIVQQLVRDDHIYMNETSGDFFIL